MRAHLLVLCRHKVVVSLNWHNAVCASRVAGPLAHVAWSNGLVQLALK